MAGFTQSVVEDAALDWLRALGWDVLHGPDIAVGEPAAARNALLPKLISGELRVTDADCVAEAVV